MKPDSTSYESLVSELKRKYFRILESENLEDIYQDNSLSGIFLPMPAPSYLESHRKVMLIGQETRAWRNKTCQIKKTNIINTETIMNSMNATLNFDKKRNKKSKFLSFYRLASGILCSDTTSPNNAAVWSNQFCISYKGGSPVKSEEFELIKGLSAKLLKAQFDVLKPKIAIFTVGSGRDKYIKDVFPGYKNSKVIVPKRLWYFEIDNIKCVRINHPCARIKNKNKYRDEAIQFAFDNV